MATGVNWEAYSHEELYRMLWEDADVADVSTLAAEWSQHRVALANHTEVLREQRAALLAGWRGTGAEEAARRLGVLADRVEKIAELAHAGEQAAERAAAALARARAMMPPPPGQPAGAASPAPDAAANWADLIANPMGTPASWTPAVPTGHPAPAFGAVGSAGFSFYAGAGATDMQKQQAVRAMQGYESSLTDSGQLIGTARDTIPAAATTPSGATAPAGAVASTQPSSAPGLPGQPGQSWQSLVGSAAGQAGGPAAGAVAGRSGAGLGQVAGLRQALGPGLRFGAGELPGGPASAVARAAEAAAARSGTPGGMVPPGAGARGGSAEQEHENAMPTIDHGLFPFAKPDSEAVIGLPTEERP